jgi:DNA-binding PadR family transcriptional regulator
VTHCFGVSFRRWAGRFGSPGRFTRSGGFPGERGWRGERFGRGRKFAAADLQLLILALLADKPRHGYEIIKAVDERSNGYYSPSPGMVYPALTYLEEIGHATVEAEGTKKRYRITDDGRAHLDANRATVDAILEELDWIGRRMDRLRQIFSGHETAERGDEAGDLESPVPSRGRRYHVLAELHVARQRLKAALIGSFGSSPEEQRRVAEILDRAADEILGRARGKPA